MNEGRKGRTFLGGVYARRGARGWRLNVGLSSRKTAAPYVCLQVALDTAGYVPLGGVGGWVCVCVWFDLVVSTAHIHAVIPLPVPPRALIGVSESHPAPAQRGLDTATYRSTARARVCVCVCVWFVYHAPSGTCHPRARCRRAVKSASHRWHAAPARRGYVWLGGLRSTDHFFVRRPHALSE